MSERRIFDPKECGVPNVNFTAVSEDDGRVEQFREQRLARGFDESELWSLDLTLSKFMLPRIKEFRDTYPGDAEQSAEFISDLDKIVVALEMIIKEGGGGLFTVEGEKEKVEEGLKLLGENFLSLWN